MFFERLDTQRWEKKHKTAWGIPTFLIKMFIKPWQSIKKYKQVYKKYKNTWESIKSIKSVPPGRIWQWSPVAVHSQINPGGTDFILFILPRVFLYFFILFYTLPWLFKHIDQQCWDASRGFIFLVRNVWLSQVFLYFLTRMFGCLVRFYTFCHKLGCKDNCLFPLQTATTQHWSRLVRLTGGVMWLSDYLDETPAPAHPGPRWETEGSHSERSISISTGMLLPPSSSMRPKIRA